MPMSATTTKESVDDLVSGIISALDVATKSVQEIEKNDIDNNDSFPTIVQELMTKSGLDKLEGVSLLSLKSSSLLSYINNLAIVILSHLERLKSNEDSEHIESHKKKAVQNSVVQRVCLEKGVKPLEKKLSYQLDKMVRSYNRMIEDESRLEAKVSKEHKKDSTPRTKSGSGSDDSEDSQSDSDSDSGESEDDALSYRPDAAALAKLSNSKSTTKHSKTSAPKSSEENPDGVYRPPKISAVAPPSAALSDRGGAAKTSNRKLQSMEEYLAENSDLPQAEVSIGSSIVNNGRGGVKTNKERQKEQEVQTYEENNFTRLPSTATKKTFREKQSEKVNNFAGEDWAMFNNNRNISEGTSRKRKPTTAWDKVKKRRS